MSFRLILTLTVVIAALLPAGAAQARYRVGISDQSAAMFDNPHFRSLGLKRVRYVVSWDWLKRGWEVAEVNAFLNSARANGFEPLVTFNASRGCYTNNRYSKSKRCRAPSVSAYSKAFRSFRARFRWIDVYAPWNEANHHSQPTDKNPRRAAQYYNALRKNCKGCTVLAADVLDEGNAVRWLKRFRRYARGPERLWGLHNYSSVNRRKPARTLAIMRYLPGQIWLTETGGIVRWGSFPYSETRAAARTKYMFRLADRYTKRRRGMRSKITRLYPYQWTGSKRGAGWDAGMTDPDGSPRKAYYTFRYYVKRRAK